jgi:hypothetical protein
MAIGTPLSTLTELAATPGNGYLIYIVDTDEPTAADQSKRITVAQLFAYVLSGGTFTGEVIFQAQPRLELPSNLAATGTVDLDMAGSALRTHATLTGNVTYTTSNRAAGRSVTVRVPNGGTLRTLSFPAGWTFVGAKPDDIEASKTGILTITAFGAADSDIVAAWAVEE